MKHLSVKERNRKLKQMQKENGTICISQEQRHEASNNRKNKTTFGVPCSKETKKKQFE
jgi:hypothetical protein